MPTGGFADPSPQPNYDYDGGDPCAVSSQLCFYIYSTTVFLKKIYKINPFRFKNFIELKFLRNTTIVYIRVSLIPQSGF